MRQKNGVRMVKVMFPQGQTGRRIIAIAAAMASVIGLVALATGRGGEAVASGVTRDAIRSIRVGMTEGELVRILGEPLSSDFDAGRGVRTLNYARAVPGARWYPMLWVHLREGRVSEVYAKKYVWWGKDDEGVYILNDAGQSETREFERTFRR